METMEGVAQAREVLGERSLSTRTLFSGLRQMAATTVRSPAGETGWLDACATARDRAGRRVFVRRGGPPAAANAG